MTNSFITIWPLIPNFEDAYFIEANCMTPWKKMTVYYPNEYKIVKDSDYVITSMERVPGNSPFINAGYNRYWADADSVGEKLIELEYEPVDFSYDVELLLKLKFALMGSSYPSKEIVAPTDTIVTSDHTYYRIIPPGVRRISAIRLVDPGY